MNKQLMPPDGELVDTFLSEAEYDACSDEQEAVAKARQRWRVHKRADGPTGRLRRLCGGTAGDSIVFPEYTRTRQLSALLDSVSLSEGVQFSSAIERSLVDGLAVGVRVTLVGFTR